MDVDGQLDIWLTESPPADLLLMPLPDNIAKEVIRRLKEEADRYWFINAERSLKIAKRIISIGDVRNDITQSALGWMAYGDALRWSGQMEEAWETLERAGAMFEAAGDKVGWARTRIGRLYLAMKLNCVKETLEDGKQAQKILKNHNQFELLVRLNMARAVVYGSLGNLRRALRLLHITLELAKKLGTPGQQHRGVLYMNVGLAHEGLGEFPQALNYYDQARSIFVARDETRNIILVELNIAYIAQAQGHYRQSLTLLHGILERDTAQFPMEHLAVKRDMTECYLQLNRYPEACSLAGEVVLGYRTRCAAYETARSLVLQGTADAELGNFSASAAALREAEDIFTALGAISWQALVRLRIGRIALEQGDLSDAYREALLAADKFKSVGQKVNYAFALLLQGQTLLAKGEFHAAAQAGSETLRIAQHDNIPSLRYSGHLLLGQVAEDRNQVSRAIRHYKAATATIERVQHNLTITLRPEFLQDKEQASRALTSLYLRAGRAGDAFETVERAKSQVLLSYLVNREGLRWATRDTHNRILIEELDRLRAEHHWLYRLAFDPSGNGNHPNTISCERAAAEIAVHERRMRAITERLYLQNSQQEGPIPITSLKNIQHTLKHGTALIEFYSDGNHWWAFHLDETKVEVHSLSATTEGLQQVLGHLQMNIDSALRMGRQDMTNRNLARLGQRILQRLYCYLLEPLALDRLDIQQLVIVPYGILHYLPFHLLYDGSQYLIEKYEVVILPAAGLATLTAPERSSGALVMAHTFEGRLPHTLAEAQMVNKLFGGRLLTDELAKRTVLQTRPVKILHIAAHGQHRLDQPDLSYLQLADGQLYADDMFQQDLSYELVTLSACETGRANVAANDELIGLGRGFLYAGAGALMVSLWRVEDISTLQFMERMYQSLSAGASKAHALRQAQQSFVQENRETHPAFWGAFQLIGNADPLSRTM
jgi:CHAT domain-containing protein